MSWNLNITIANQLSHQVHGVSASCTFALIGQLEPITIYDRGGVHVSIHFAKDPPPEHPGIAVMVISTVNTSALLVTDVLFQAAVPKVTRTLHQCHSRSGYTYIK